MQGLYTFLTVLVIVTMLTGLFLSFRYRGRQKAESDIGVSSNVQKNPLLVNPIFWTYILFLTIAMGLVWAFKLYHKTPF